MSATQTTTPPITGHMTPRELLVYVAGEEHGLPPHSVASREPVKGGLVTFTCTCGVQCTVGAVPKYLDALKSVPENKP